MVTKNRYLVSVVGPTAVGKTALAIDLARHFQTEIISADSRQFYKEMQIGTAKPSVEELGLARHHFIDSHSIEQYYSVGEFEREAIHLLEDLFERHSVVILVGGSGLFTKAIWQGLDEMPSVNMAIRSKLNKQFEEGGLSELLEELKELDPDYFSVVDRKNHQRVIRALEVIRSSGTPFSAFRRGGISKKRNFVNLKIGLEMDRKELFDRIDLRMEEMIRLGLFSEAEELLPFRNHNALQTVGYQEIFGYLDGAYPMSEAVRLLKRNSRRYAKRQLTWFKNDKDVLWMSPKDRSRTIQWIEAQLDT